MHRLQQHILSQLVHNPRRRYAELKPAETEGNLFMYHLRQVMKAGLVAKNPDGSYCLTPEGLRFADGLSLETFTPRKQARMVTLLIIQNSDGEYLLYRRKRQPLLGQVGFPYGKVHMDETLVESAQRELKEKTGLEAHLSHRGDGYITIYEDGEPSSQIFAHVFYGSHPQGELKAETPVGSAFWSAPQDDRLMPSVPDLIHAIAKNPNRHFFLELTYR